MWLTLIFSATAYSWGWPLVRSGIYGGLTDCRQETLFAGEEFRIRIF